MRFMPKYLKTSNWRILVCLPSARKMVITDGLQFFNLIGIILILRFNSHLRIEYSLFNVTCFILIVLNIDETKHSMIFTRVTFDCLWV